MPSPKKNKTIAAVRVWKRRDRQGRQYCTVRLPNRKAVTRSCHTWHRGTAEEFGALMLKELMQPSSPQRGQAAEIQLEFTPPRNRSRDPHFGRMTHD